MAIYTVHSRQPDTRNGDDIVFVKEGFCWPAFLFTAVWLLYKRMWIVLAMVVAYELAVAASGDLLNLGALALLPGSLAVSLVLGFEGTDIYRWTLRLRGYREIGVQSGQSLEDAELGFFASLPSAAAPAASNVVPTRPPLLHDTDPLGLFSPTASR